MTETDLLPMVTRRVVATLCADIFAGAGVGLVIRRCWKEKELVTIAAAGVGFLYRMVAVNFKVCVTASRGIMARSGVIPWMRCLVNHCALRLRLGGAKTDASIEAD